MTLNSDAKFKEKLTCDLEYDMRNLENFHKSSLNGSFYPKQKMYELNIYIGVIAMKNDTKFEKELTCGFKIDMTNLTNFESNTQKSQKFALSWAPFD